MDINSFLKIIFIILAILFIIILIIKRFVYFRPSYKFSVPKENYEDVREGNLHAWYKKGGSDKVVLFCHGNKGNISHTQDKILEFLKMGHSILVFDYSGFGQSRGVPNEQLCYSNGDIFMNYLTRKGYSKNNIIPYGEDMGSAVASYIARKYSLPMVVIESGIPSMKTVVKSWNSFVGFLGFLFSEFNTQDFLKGYNGKILFLHCVNDEVIPYDSMANIRNLATRAIDMNGSHYQPEIPWEDVKSFLN